MSPYLCCPRKHLIPHSKHLPRQKCPLKLVISMHVLFSLASERVSNEKNSQTFFCMSVSNNHCFLSLILGTVILLQGASQMSQCKESAWQCKRCRRLGFNLWVRKIPWRRKWQPTSGFLPGESHGQRSLVGYSPWGHSWIQLSQLSTHTYTW